MNKLQEALTGAKTKKKERELIEQLTNEVSRGKRKQDDDDDEDVSGIKKKPTNHPVFSLKLTEKERKKKKANKERLRQEAHAAAEKRRLAAIDGIDKIMTNISKDEAKAEVKRQKKEQKKAEQLLKPRRFGKHKVPLTAPIVLTSDELPSSLREVCTLTIAITTRAQH